jgi:hypothetical protein
VYVNSAAAGPLLARLADSDDEDIAEAANEAMLEADASNPFEDGEEEDDDDEFTGGGYVN